MDARPHNGKVEQERNSHWSSPSKLSHQAAQWKNLLAKSLPYLQDASRRRPGTPKEPNHVFKWKLGSTAKTHRHPEIEITYVVETENADHPTDGHITVLKGGIDVYWFIHETGNAVTVHDDVSMYKRFVCHSSSGRRYRTLPSCYKITVQDYLVLNHK